MVIIAHPDDAEFLCAGTIAKWCAGGLGGALRRCHGRRQGHARPGDDPEKLAAIREEEQRAACRVLGVKECILLGYPDGFTSRRRRAARPDRAAAARAPARRGDHLGWLPRQLQPPRPPQRRHRHDGRHLPDRPRPAVLPGARRGRARIAPGERGAARGRRRPRLHGRRHRHWEKKVDAILCHTSQIGGRTKADFLKERDEREEKDPGKPMEERFRRWSIRRPPRQQEEDAAKAEGQPVETRPQRRPGRRRGGAPEAAAGVGSRVLSSKFSVLSGKSAGADRGRGNARAVTAIRSRASNRPAAKRCSHAGAIVVALSFLM